MTIPKNHRASEIIKAEINHLPNETRLAHMRYHAAKELVGTLHALAASELLRVRGGEDFSNPKNSRGSIMSLVRSEAVSEFATVRIALEVIEQSQAFKDAQKDMQPLLDELEASEKAEADQAHKVGLATEKVRQAEKAAVERALAKSASDPEVKAARKALESTIEKVS